MTDFAFVTSAINLTHTECAERGAALTVDTYDIVLDVANASSEAKTFRSSSTVTFTSAVTDTWIDVIAEEIEQVVVNGVEQSLEAYDGARVPLSGLLAEPGGDDRLPGAGATNVVTVVAQCRYSRTGEGIHRFTDPQDGHTYLYTHLEPTNCRRMLACFEQPDLKGAFEFTIRAPKDWVVRSGQPETSRVDGGDGTVTVRFGRTPRQSSYLVAMAAGPYHLVEDIANTEFGQVPLGLMCRASMAKHLDSDDIWAVTRAGLDFYGREFALPYPWGKYDQIFVPEYNIGAMENPGLVTFTERLLPRHEATVAERTNRAEVIMHEMAHMWFGDLVTPHWWDDLWLKESFADLMGYQVSQEVTPYDGAWTIFALGRKQWAYLQDQLPTTHPVVAVIDDLEAAGQNFDGITYAKGASVLKQLQAYAGRDQFFDAAKAYFAEHAWGTATLADLLESLRRTTGQDQTQWAAQWLQTCGPSVLTPLVTRDSAGALESLAILHESVDPRTGEHVLRPHRLQVGTFAIQHDTLVRTGAASVALDGSMTHVHELRGVEADLVLLNDGDLTYAVCRLDDRSVDAAESHLSSLEDTLARGLVWSQLINLVRDNYLPATRYLHILSTQLPKEQDSNLLMILTNSALTTLSTYVPTSLRDSYAEQMATAGFEAMRAAPAGSDAQRVWARFVGLAGAHTDSVNVVLRGLLDGDLVPAGLVVDHDLEWAWATGLATRGALSDDELERVRSADDTMSGRTAYATLLAARPTREAREAAWRELDRADDLTNDRQQALIAGWRAPAEGLRLADLDEEYFARLEGWWTEQPQSMATRVVSGLFPRADLDGGDATTHPVVVRAKAWLDAHPGAAPTLRRIVIEQLDNTQRALRAQAG